MSKVIYFILISLFLFTSCKKDASNPVVADPIPPVPTLSSPIDTSSNIAVPVVLTWKESSGAKGYTLQVSPSSSFSSFVFNKSDIITTTQQVPDLNYLAIYYWRVSATNSAGTSDWSKVWSFTTTGEAASVPQLSLPANGAVGQQPAPVLVWNQITNANKYSLQVSTNTSFTSYVYSADTLTATRKLITGLSLGTKYYWRVSAANSYGSKGWSDTWSFTIATGSTCSTSTVDYSGKTYHTVQIGTQCWLKENLDIGTMINSTTGGFQQTNNGVIEKYCYDNNAANCATYGGLYEWTEAMQYVTTEKAQGICPTGWHIPTKAEYQTLANSVGNDGNALKAIGQGSGGGAGTNTSGFSGLLAGYRGGNGIFYSLGFSTYFWSSTESDATNANNFYLYYNNSYIKDLNDFKYYGFSVRCVQD